MSQMELITDIGKLFNLSRKKTLYLDIFCTIQRETNFIRINREYVEDIGYNFAINTSDITVITSSLKKEGLIDRVRTNVYLLDKTIFKGVLENPYKAYINVRYDHLNNRRIVETKLFGD